MGPGTRGPPLARREAGPPPEEVPTGGDGGAGGPQTPRPGGAPRSGGRRAGSLQGSGMRQRRRATTQGQSLMGAWHASPWPQGPRQVCRLQQRLSHATQGGAVRTARQLQQLLRQLWEAHVVAGRRLRQDHCGKQTAGIDGGQSLTPAERWPLAQAMRLDGRAPPLRRPWIPPRGAAEDQRPRGRPPQQARARQTGVRQGLAPAGEARLSAHPSGCRPGRAGGEALAALWKALRGRPP
jgi:hypothetical protein